MKKLGKVLLSSGLLHFVLSNPVWATDTMATDGMDITKILLLVGAGALVVLILYLSYKSDSPSQIKPRNMGAKSLDRLQKDLVEKDTSYEMEDNEYYADDRIDPISISSDEDEISLFESVNNPDTEKMPEFNLKSEEDDVDLSEFGLDVSAEEIEEKAKANSDFGGTMVFNSNELNTKLTSEDEFVADFLSESTENEEEPEEIIQLNNDVVEVRKELDIFAQENEDLEETEEIVEEEVKDSFENSLAQPEEEFLGFTTIAPKKAKRGSTKKVEEIVEDKKVENVVEDVDGSSDDFLAQMAKNLGGEVEEPIKKATAKKTTTAKKTSTKKTADKKVEDKKTSAKKTTATKKATTTKKTTTKKTTAAKSTKK